MEGFIYIKDAERHGNVVGRVMVKRKVEEGLESKVTERGEMTLALKQMLD